MAYNRDYRPLAANFCRGKWEEMVIVWEISGAYNDGILAGIEG